ncbi:MAG: hypothetical protein RLZZ01_2656 [Actinomycetota bacterium]|jgi:uncharacterized protein (DUF1330 family)
MAALIIVNYDVVDPDGMETYRSVARPALADRGSTALVNTSSTVDLGEGPGAGTNTVVLRFDSVEAAREAWFSEAYQAALPMRLAAISPRSAVLVETLPGVEI